MKLLWSGLPYIVKISTWMQDPMFEYIILPCDQWKELQDEIEKGGEKYVNIGWTSYFWSDVKRVWPVKLKSEVIELIGKQDEKTKDAIYETLIHNLKNNAEVIPNFLKSEESLSSSIRLYKEANEENQED